MKKHLILFLVFVTFPLYWCPLQAQVSESKRIPQFTNDIVKVWKTVIYTQYKNKLALHRHECDRVVVALTNGLLKITNDKGVSHYFKLEKNKAYYFAKDAPNELHYDENMSRHPIKIMVIELKNHKDI